MSNYRPKQSFSFFKSEKIGYHSDISHPLPSGHNNTAPGPGFEPGTSWLTAKRSTTELSRNVTLARLILAPLIR